MSRPTLRRADFRGLPINVEIEPGQVKSGTDDRGEAWSHTYKYAYGEVPGTEGEDGDPVDVYLGPEPEAEVVHVVHQLKRDGTHDEDKVMLGWSDRGQAEQAYREHGPDFGFGSMDTMLYAQFLHGYLAGNRVGGWESPQEKANAGRRRYGSGILCFLAALALQGCVSASWKTRALRDEGEVAKSTILMKGALEKFKEYDLKVQTCNDVVARLLVACPKVSAEDAFTRELNEAVIKTNAEMLGKEPK